MSLKTYVWSSEPTNSRCGTLVFPALERGSELILGLLGIQPSLLCELQANVKLLKQNKKQKPQMGGSLIMAPEVELWPPHIWVHVYTHTNNLLYSLGK